MQPRILCIFAIPRTGSSRLIQLLTLYPGLNVKGEIFNIKWSGRLSESDLSALRAASGGIVSDNDSLCAWRRENPGKTLETLYRNGGERAIAFKVFNNHVRRHLIDAEILRRPDVAFIILRRKPIESFISLVKAQGTTAYANFDTTNVKVNLSHREFVKWCTQIMDWYRWCELSLRARDIPFVDMSYERDLNTTDDIALHRITELLDMAGVHPGHPREPKRTIKKQDNAGRYQDKAANWSEFEAAVRAMPGGGELLEWAEAMP